METLNALRYFVEMVAGAFGSILVIFSIAFAILVLQAANVGLLFESEGSRARNMTVGLISFIAPGLGVLFGLRVNRRKYGRFSKLALGFLIFAFFSYLAKNLAAMGLS